MNDYAGANEFAKEAFRLYNFNEREILILDLVRSLSYELGRPRAIIPKHMHIAALTGLAKPHVSILMTALDRKRVLSVDNEYRYMFVVNPEQWIGVELRKLHKLSPFTKALWDWLREPNVDPKGEPLLFDELGPLMQEAQAAAQKPKIWPTRGDGGPPDAVHQDLKGGVTSRESADRSRPVEQASQPGQLATATVLGLASAQRRSGEEVTKRVTFEEVTEKVTDRVTKKVTPQVADPESVAPKVTKKVTRGVTEKVTFAPCLSVCTVSAVSDVLTGSSPEDIKTVETFKHVQGGPGKVTKKVTSSSWVKEDEFVARYREVCSSEADQGWGGFWRNRYREDPEACECALERLMLRRDNPRPFTTSPGAWMRSEHARFLRLNPAKAQGRAS